MSSSEVVKRTEVYTGWPFMLDRRNGPVGLLRGWPWDHMGVRGYSRELLSSLPVRVQREVLCAALYGKSNEGNYPIADITPFHGLTGWEFFLPFGDKSRLELDGVILYLPPSFFQGFPGGEGGANKWLWDIENSLPDDRVRRLARRFLLLFPYAELLLPNEDGLKIECGDFKPALKECPRLASISK